MVAPPVRYTQTPDGVAIAWTDHGEGPPLLVSTGPMLPLDQGWDEGGPWLRLSRSFRVVRFDPRGCGLSERQNVFGSFYDEARDLAAVADAVGEARVALMGYYIGTPAAVIAALDDPERYSHLVLHSPMPLAAELEPEQQQAEAGLADDVISGLLRLGWQYHQAAARRALLTLIAPEADLETIASLAESMHHYPSIERLLQLIPELHALNLAPELNRITARTLICISPDEMVQGHGRAWTQAIPGAQLTVMREASTSMLFSGGQIVEDLASAVEQFVRVSRRPLAPVKATRTVIFTDIEGSTGLIDRLGDARARMITSQVEQLTRTALHSHGGAEVKTMGDGVMAWFTMASSALDAAIEIERSITERADLPVQVRIGLNAGEPITEGDDLYGATVNQAARIMSEADGGEIFVSDLVRGLVQGRNYQFHDLGLRHLRGFEEAVRLFSLDWDQS